MTPVRLRASFLKELEEASAALGQLTALLPEAQTQEERLALLRALTAKATTIIVLVNEVIDASVA